VTIGYLVGLAAGAWLTRLTWQFLSVLAPEYARPTTWAMAAGALFWPLLPVVAVVASLLGVAIAMARKTPK
jgi:hypothetical protein